MNAPHGLERFVAAQEGDYEAALREITAGRKRTHWMWYIFPQLDGLGSSSMARQYAIKNADEARAYLAHPILGERLQTCARAALAHGEKSATEIFGTPDDLKLRSSATLFAAVSEEGSVFHRLLTRFYPGGADPATLRLLGGGID